MKERAVAMPPGQPPHESVRQSNSPFVANIESGLKMTKQRAAVASTGGLKTPAFTLGVATPLEPIWERWGGEWAE